MVKLFKFLYILLIFSSGAFAQHHPHTEHGFILLGTKQLHAYHLAKFNSPHEYQILFELQLSDKDGNTVDITKIKQNYHADVLSLLSEDHFLIKDLSSTRPIKRFKVKLFKGYLRDRTQRELLLENLTLSVVSIKYFQHISAADRGLTNKKLIVVCDSIINTFYGANFVQGVNEDLKNFEEIVEIDSFYSVAGGEDSESFTLKCSYQLQGVVVDIGFKTDVHPSIPFTERSYLRAKIPSLGSWQFYISKPLILDINSINN